MAETTLAFNILTKYKDSGADKASRDMDRLGRSGSRMGSMLKTAGAAGAIALGAGVVLAGRSLVGMTKNAIEDEAAQKRLALALQNNAGATKGQVAATESWITAQGKAFGVTDDELRPALARLVTATHDVGKAQRQASLAMDISAGTGKSLKSVTEALMKAQNGNMAGLSKLGIATKNAAGETLTFEQATKQMSETFKGQAATNADTLEGKMKRLSVVWDESKEAIGARLIPILTRLSTWFLAEGLPAIQRFSDWVKVNLGPPLARVGETVQTQLIPPLTAVGEVLRSGAEFILQHKTAAAALLGTITALVAITEIHTAVMAVQAAGGLLPLLKATTLVSTATKTYAAVQWLLNAALTANPIGLVVVGLVALGAGLVLAYKKSETFRNVINGVFSFLKGAVTATLGFVRSHWQVIVAVIGGPIAVAALLVAKNWNAIKSAVTGAVSTVIGFIKNNWQAILATLIAGPFGLAVALIAGHWSQIKAAVSAGVGKVIGVVKTLPGRITGALGNLGSLLYNAGRSVIQGLINGVESMIGSLTSKLGSITKLIPIKKGPPAKDAALLRPAGRLIMGGLIDGIDDGIEPLSKKLAEVGKKIREGLEKQRDHLKSVLSGLRSDFASLRDSVAGSFTGDLFSASATEAVTDEEGNVTSAATSAGQNFVASLTAKKGELQALLGAFKKLQGWGLKPAFLSQLFASGNGGLILDLAAMGKGGALNAGNLFGDVTTLSQQLGTTVANNDPISDRIDKTNEKLDKVTDALRDLKGAVNRQGADFGRELNSVVASANRGNGRR